MSNSETRRLVIGGVYEHCSGNGHRYRVLAVKPDATGYEESGKISGSNVEYTQLYDGESPKGTIWTRDLDDFTQEKFKLVQKPSLPVLVYYKILKKLIKA